MWIASASGRIAGSGRRRSADRQDGIVLDGARRQSWPVVAAPGAWLLCRSVGLLVTTLAGSCSARFEASPDRAAPERLRIQPLVVDVFVGQDNRGVGRSAPDGATIVVWLSERRAAGCVPSVTRDWLPRCYCSALRRSSVAMIQTGPRALSPSVLRQPLGRLSWNDLQRVTNALHAVGRFGRRDRSRLGLRRLDGAAERDDIVDDVDIDVAVVEDRAPVG